MRFSNSNEGPAVCLALTWFISLAVAKSYTEAMPYVTCRDDLESHASNTFDLGDQSLDAGVELHPTPSVHLSTLNGYKRSIENFSSRLCLSNCGTRFRSFLARVWDNCLDTSRWVKVGISAVHCTRKLAHKLNFLRVLAAIRVKVYEALHHVGYKSICHVHDKTNICVCWVNYNSNMLRDGQSADPAFFAASCVKIGGRVEFKAATSDGGIVFACE